METKLCRRNIFDGGWECANCGNHVCGRCAEMNNGICPHCFGRLYLIKN